MPNIVKPENKISHEYYVVFAWEKTSYSNYKLRMKHWLSKEEAIVPWLVHLTGLKKKDKANTQLYEVKKYTKYTIEDIRKLWLNEFVNCEANLNNLKVPWYKWFFTKKDIIDFYNWYYPEHKDFLKKIDTLINN